MTDEVNMAKAEEWLEKAALAERNAVASGDKGGLRRAFLSLKQAFKAAGTPLTDTPEMFYGADRVTP